MVNMTPCKNCEKRQPMCQGFKCREWTLAYTQRQHIANERRKRIDDDKYFVDTFYRLKKQRYIRGV